MIESHLENKQLIILGVSVMAPETENEETYPDEIIVVGVKVRDLGEVKKTRTDDPSVKVGDWVLLDLDGDHTFGKVYLPPQHLSFTSIFRFHFSSSLNYHYC